MCQYRVHVIGGYCSHVSKREVDSARKNALRNDKEGRAGRAFSPCFFPSPYAPKPSVFRRFSSSFSPVRSSYVAMTFFPYSNVAGPYACLNPSGVAHG